MGMFAASVAFRTDNAAVWEQVKPEILGMYKGLDGLVDNLESAGPDYAIVSPYGDMGMFLAEMPGKISALVKGWAVFCTCVDSDFAMLEVYRDGELLEKSCVGEVYEEYLEFCPVDPPDLALWTNLLQNSNEVPALEAALFGSEVFVEDQLRQISRLTGLPIFDDALIFSDEQ